MSKNDTDDMIGLKSGKLTVIAEGKKVPQKRKARGKLYTVYRYYSICECSCGNIKEIRNDLIKGQTVKSCGCLVKETTKIVGHANKKDIVGKKYGRLTVLKQYRAPTLEYRVLCQCECGNTLDSLMQAVKTGKTRSCGCLAQENRSNTGKKYGPVTGAANLKPVHEKAYVENTSLYNIDIDNKKINSNNTSGVTGVYFNNKSQKWTASIGFQGKSHYLGAFTNKTDAINARKEAEDHYFKPMLDKHKDFRKTTD